MNKNTVNFADYREEKPFTTEELDAIEAAAKAKKTEGTGIVSAAMARLSWLLSVNVKQNSTREDDRLIEIIAKYLPGTEGYDSLFGMAVEVAFRQIKSHAVTNLIKLQVEYQDYEDYFQIVYMELCARLKQYDSRRNRIPAYIVEYVKGEFFEQKNRSSGVTTNTKYNATVTKHAVNAKAELVASGNKNPSSADITSYINATYNLKNPYSVRQVENALSHLVIQTEMDETVHDDSYNPEAAFFQTETRESLKTLNFRGDKTLKAMFEIYVDYYLNGLDDEEYYAQHPDKIRVEKKALPNTYLLKKMEEKLNTKLSLHRIVKIRSLLQKELHNKGLSPSRLISKSATPTLLSSSEELAENLI